MRIVIAGGTGQVGRSLVRHFVARGDEVTVLSRRPESDFPCRICVWDGRKPGDWVTGLDGAEVVINLAGRSVDCRYTSENRKAILNSRVDSTRVIGEAIQMAKAPPRVWLQASTATIYADRYDAPNDETIGIIGGNEKGVPDTWKFSIAVAKAWEATLDEAEVPDTRRVAMRSAMTMSPDRGGIFHVLSRLVRLGLGGRVGDGKQFVSWIHEMDFLAAVDFLIQREDLSGAVNLAAPNPLPWDDFMAGLRSAWNRPFGLPATRWMAELGAFVLRTETELIFKSRRVVPGTLLEAGFEFQYPEWPEAARDLVRRW